MARCWQCDASASVKRSKDGKPACVVCFTDAFEAVNCRGFCVNEMIALLMQRV